MARHPQRKRRQQNANRYIAVEQMNPPTCEWQNHLPAGIGLVSVLLHPGELLHFLQECRDGHFAASWSERPQSLAVLKQHGHLHLCGGRTQKGAFLLQKERTVAPTLSLEVVYKEAARRPKGWRAMGEMGIQSESLPPTGERGERKLPDKPLPKASPHSSTDGLISEGRIGQGGGVKRVSWG